MVIETERLWIRNYTPEDWVSLKWIWEDFGKTEYAQYDRPHRFSDPELQEMVKQYSETGRYHAVCVDGKMVGYIQFKSLDPENCALGYCFHSSVCGKGYAREALLALLDAYREQYGIRVFSAGTGLKNLPSIGFLKRCGFEQTGTEKVSFYRDAQGQPIRFDGGLFEKQVADK